MSTPVVLAVDAGNTKTRALIVDAEGRILGSARSGTGDIYAFDDPGLAVAEVARAVGEAQSMAGIELTGLGGAAFLLAGVDWPADEEYWAETLRTVLPPSLPRTVLNDGFALLRVAQDDGVGIAVSVGTSAAVAGRGPTGDLWTASWWMRHDLGGGGLANAALREVVLAEIGEAPASSFRDILLDEFAVDSVEELLQATTRRVEPLDRLALSRVAPRILAAAEAGDAAARALVEDQAAALTRYCAAVARRVGIAEDDAFAVTLGGSILTSEHDLLRRTLEAGISEVLPNAVLTPSRVEPVVGAALEALVLAGVPLAAARAALTETAP